MDPDSHAPQSHQPRGGKAAAKSRARHGRRRLAAESQATEWNGSSDARAGLSLQEAVYRSGLLPQIQIKSGLAAGVAQAPPLGRLSSQGASR